MSVNYDRVCRLCLSSRGELLPIFPTTSSDGREPPVLASKIKDCVSVQINENDDLSTCVCRKCVDNVNNWHIFKKVCERTQIKLQTLVKKDASQLEEVKIKSEPLSDEAYDDGVVIHASYPGIEQNASSSHKVQPEGPPILASLGLTPRSDKGHEDEEEEYDGELNENTHFPKVPNMPEVSITVMRPTGETLQSRQGIQEIASKNCLVCDRAYRYSHNARRHELTSHGFDRYTNKVTNNKKSSKSKRSHMLPKLRPNPFNPKARLMPNPISHKLKMQMLPSLPQHQPMHSKRVPHKVIPKPVPVKSLPPKAQNNLPYPLRIKALKDLQIKKKEPQILKTLLTSKPEVLVSEPEIVNSGAESPETLISEPEIASFQVEAILTEPDAFDQQPEEDEDEMDGDLHKNNQSAYDTVDMESDNEIEIAREQENYTNEQQNEEQVDEQEEERDQGVDNDQGADNEQGEDHEPEVEHELEGEHEPEGEHEQEEERISDNDNEIQAEESQANENPEENHEETVEGHEDGEMYDGDHTEQRIDEDYEIKEDDNDGLDDYQDAQDNQEENEDDIDEEEEMAPSLAPVVEISEDIQNNSMDNSEQNDEDELNEEELDETAEANDNIVDGEQKVPDPDKQYITKIQRDFILKHRDVIEQINTKRCLCCDREYPRRKAVIQHLQKNGHKVPKHTCYNCVITFGHIGALLSHMRANCCTHLWKIIYNENGITDDMIIEGESKYSKEVQYKDIFNARSYACKLCPAKFQLKQFILKHVLDVHEDGQSAVIMACVHCGARFKDRAVWKKHIRNGECTVYIACDLCPEKFANVQSFNNHALAVHAGSFDPENQTKCVDGRPTDCPICEKKNSSYQNLIKHLKLFHNEDKPHYCQNCDAKFEKTDDLNKHIYMEHSDKAMGITVKEESVDMSIVKEEAEEYHYSCTECNAIFETVDAWTDHQVAEHNQVAHHCDQCEKKFLRPSELAEHKNTHLRVKLYPCSICSDSYSTPQKLADHVQVAHPGASVFAAGETEFFCEICIRSFKSRQAYSNHMRIHSKIPTTNRKPGDTKSFAPQIIGKPIKQFPIVPGNLQFKTNLIVPNAPYSCDICGKGFMHKKNIWKHKKVLHADLVNDRNDSEENTMHASTEEDDCNIDENGSVLSTPQFDSFNFNSYGNNSQTPTQPKKKKEQQVGNFACDLCYKKFPLRTSLWKHKRAKHGIINASTHGIAETQIQSTPIQNQAAVTVAAATPPTSGDGSRSSCTICRITFADKKSYYRHRKNVHKSTSQVCKICGIPLNSTLELYEHLRAAHARELLGFNASQGSSNIKQDISGQELDADYEGEQETNDPSADYQARYPCDTCGKQFVGLLALQNHQCINQISTEPQSFNCEICHKSYSSIAALKSHRGWHLRSPDGKAAANNSGLWMPQHKVTHKVSKHEIVDAIQLAKVTHSAPAASVMKRRLPPEVEVTVVNPNKKMRSDDSVEMEQNMTGGLEDRYCTICDKEFTKRAAFQRHMDEVHQPNSVFCPVCDKSFTRKSTLLVHMRKHYEGGEGSSSVTAQEDDTYGCDLCGAQYQSENALTMHRVKHHGEQLEDSEDEGNVSAAPPGEFTCNQCGDGVATPRDLIAHRTMHTTASKYFCTICKVFFARSLDLSAHTKARHANDDDKVFFPCAMCDRFYMNKKSLQRHIEMAH